MMNTGWETFTDWENRRELRDEREAVRLRKLERVMQDYVGRPNAQSWATASALFMEAPDLIHRIEEGNKHDTIRRAEGRALAQAEAASMATAEELRKSFRPKPAPAKHRKHVRAPRSVRADVVAYGRLLGVVCR